MSFPSICNGRPWPLVVLASLVLASMLGCAPPRVIRPYISDMGAASVQTGGVGRLRYVASASYLPGPVTGKELGPKQEYVCPGGSKVAIRPGDQLVYAQDACRALEHVLRYFPSARPLDSVRLWLIPEDAKYVGRWLSVGLRPRLTLALRNFADVEFGRRYVARALAHELFHVYVPSGALGMGDRTEEAAASLFESCIELELYGSTKGDLTVPEQRRVMLANLDGGDHPVTTSLQGGQDAHDAFEALELVVPVLASDPVSSGKLRAECAKLSAK